MAGGRAAVSVPLAEVRHVRLTRGLVAERPVVQAIIGVLLTALGVVWAIRVLGWLFRGGTMWDVEILMLGWLVGGPLIVRAAVQRGLVLHVETASTTRKLGFGKRVTAAELKKFIDDAKGEHGLEIFAEVGLDAAGPELPLQRVASK